MANIMLVDDDVLGSELIQRLLERRGHSVVYYPNASDVIASLDKSLPDLVLLDVMMPTVSGLELLQELRKTYNPLQLPILMLTSKGEADDVVEALRFGANDYLTKPVKLDIALARMKIHLQLAQLNRDRVRLKQVESLAAMITTYSHEFNNQLAVAQNLFEGGLESIDDKKCDRTLRAVQRMIETAEKIDKIDLSKVKVDDYTNEIAMIPL